MLLNLANIVCLGTYAALQHAGGLPKLAPNQQS